MTGLQNSSNPSLADFDLRAFARAVRHGVQASGKAYRVLALEIGVTLSDLSRAAAGQAIGTGKVIALCNAFRLDLMGFYVAPDGGPASGLPLKGGAETSNKINVFQLASRETDSDGGGVAA